MQDATDLKAIKKSDGKVPHKHAGRLLIPNASARWPSLPLSVRGQAEAFHIDKLPAGVGVRIVLARWRQSAEMYLQAWRAAVVEAYAGVPEVDLIELNMIDLSVRALSNG